MRIWSGTIRGASVLALAGAAAIAWAQSTEYNTGPSGSPGAQPHSTTESPAASTGAKGQGALTGTKLRGSVKSVDPSAKQVTLADGQHLEIDASTKITRDGKRASLRDLKQGDDVRASFSPGNDTKVEQITATSPQKSTAGSNTSPSGGSRRAK